MIQIKKNEHTKKLYSMNGYTVYLYTLSRLPWNTNKNDTTLINLNLT